MRNYYLILILSGVFLYSLLGCQKQASYTIKDDYYVIIRKYVLAHRQYNSFLLMSTGQLFNENRKYRGFLLGPLYENMEKEIQDFSLIDFLEIDGKRIYLSSEASSIIQQKELDINYCVADSIVVFTYGEGQKIYSHSSLINYLKRSMLLYKNKGVIYINNSSDTLFLPQFKLDQLINK